MKRAWILALLLAGCASAPPPDPQVLLATAEPVVLQVCLPLTSWTPAQQKQMRREYDALGANAILRNVFRDWVDMRDEDRACIAAQKPAAH